MCQHRRNGGSESGGRSEDGEMGFTEPFLNWKGDKRRPTNDQSGTRSSMNCNNSAGDGTRSGFVHDQSTEAASKDHRCWKPPSSLSIDESSIPRSSWSCPTTGNSTPLWGDDRNNSRPLDANLLGSKAKSAGMPMSLRMLKRRQVQNRALSSVYDPHGTHTDCSRLLTMSESTHCSFKKAFSSMVFMIRTLQSYTIQLRQTTYEELQEILAAVQRELHSSFLWLFQQVFACTPKLMLALMLLLANYTVYSVGNHVAYGAMTSPHDLISNDTALVGNIKELSTPSDAARQHFSRPLESLLDVDRDAPSAILSYEDSDSWRSSQTENGAGGSGRSFVAVSGDSDCPRQLGSIPQSIPLLSDQDLNSINLGASSEQRGVIPRVHLQVKESSQPPLVLDHDTRKRLVAPVTVKLEPDNYSCYDRTELIYQQAICSDASNALLLANYAQFLFLVRHDHERAEQFFKRAINADTSDGDIIARYASFLWLACDNRVAAEKAYRTLVDLDPTNPYFTGVYANFLWQTGEQGPCCNIDSTA